MLDRAYLGSRLHREEDVGQQRVRSEGEVEGDEPSQQRPEHQENMEEPGDRTGSGQKEEPSQNRAQLLVPGSFSNCRKSVGRSGLFLFDSGSQMAPAPQLGHPSSTVMTSPLY